MSRTFRTVGSGSTQTLEKIENNKIPVYETKAAAEADIANLSDGQIIATKDEGNEYAKPVDVVQDGNMHAVTSNAVAEAFGEWENLITSDNIVIKGLNCKNGKYLNIKLVDVQISTSGQQIAQLPTEYIPSQILRLVCFYFDSNTFEISCGFLQIEITGEIKCFPTTGNVYGDIITKII